MKTQTQKLKEIFADGTIDSLTLLEKTGLADINFMWHKNRKTFVKVGEIKNPICEYRSDARPTIPVYKLA